MVSEYIWRRKCSINTTTMYSKVTKFGGTRLNNGVRIIWHTLIKVKIIFLSVKNRKNYTSKHKKLQSNKDQ